MGSGTRSSFDTAHTAIAPFDKGRLFVPGVGKWICVLLATIDSAVEHPCALSTGWLEVGSTLGHPDFCF